MPAPHTSHRIEQDARWRAIVARDPLADGTFFYSVKTTGVYCRPSCGARRPHPSNVQFHTSPADAQRAGFRACRRCRPDELPLEKRYAAKIARACRTIESAGDMPRLADLAKQAGLSPYHFHRIFKRIVGLTPRGYAQARRRRRVQTELRRSRTVTDAIYEAGFNSGGRFYASSGRLLGMTPTEFRDGGRAAEIEFATGECSLGAILVAQSARGICAVLLGDRPAPLREDLQRRFPHASLRAGNRAFADVVAKVVGMIEAPGASLDLPLDVRGTAFQQRVWDALRNIPAGATLSYAALAAKIGSPGAVRAVASACAANPLAVAIPCHRVVRSDGALAGYRWGIARKRTLLNRERGRTS